MTLKNINYKYTTIGLALILLVCIAWCVMCSGCLDDKKGGNRDGMYNDKKSRMMHGMHEMSDGSMMMNNDSAMNMMDMTMTDMVSMMKGKTGKALEKEFITGMIPHHQGAVDMAKLLLEDKTISKELQQFAQDIITAQESEIKMMNEWLKKY
jgi:uncharacterized protein (DUF305 family)